MQQFMQRTFTSKGFIEKENHMLKDMLTKLESDVNALLESALSKVPCHWTKKIHETITAETSEHHSVLESTLSTIIPWSATSICVLSAKNRMQLMQIALESAETAKEKKTAAFIQLSQYPSYTDRIMQKCKALVSNIQQRMSENAAFVIKQLFSCDSPWLFMKPSDECDAISVSIDMNGFSNALVSALVREYPSDDSFLHLHDSVPLGEPRADALAKMQQLQKDHADVEGAVEAIQSAFASVKAESSA